VAAGLLLQVPFGLVFAWGAIVPHVRAEGWSPLLTGAVFSATPFGYGMGTLIGGRFSDRFSPRAVCAGGVGLLVAGFALSLSLPSGLSFVVAYGWLALGLGGGMALAGSVAAAVALFPSRSGLVGGAITAAYAAAAIFQAPLLSLLAAHLGWLTALRIVAAALVAVGIAAVLALPGPAARPARGRNPPLRNPLALLARRPVWAGCLLALTTACLGPYAVVNLAPQARDAGLALIVVAVVLLFFSLGNTAGRLAGGASADRWGITVAGLGVIAANLLAALLAALGSGGAASFLTIGAAAGLGLGGSAGLVSRLARESVPEAPNSAFGLVFAAYATGALSGPLIGALAGAGRLAWLVVGLPSLLGLLALRLRTGSRGAAGKPAEELGGQMGQIQGADEHRSERI